MREIRMYLHKHINHIEAVAQKAGEGVSMKMLLSSEESPNFAMRNFIIASGGHMPLHTNEVEHEQYVLSGRAMVQIGDKIVEAKAGDIFLLPAGVAHSYKTIGNESYSFLCLVPNKQDNIVLK
jgi:quercetin dioxygenase-like cupin family protein